MKQIHGPQLISVLAALAVTGLGTPAVAAAPAPAPTTEGGDHCVARLTGTHPPVPVCFATFAEALEYASGGRLTDGPKNAADAVRDPGFVARVNASNDEASTAEPGRAKAAAANVVISIEYTQSGWVTPSELIWTGTKNCTTSTNNTDYEISSMPAGWDNVISSHRAFGNCWVKHYENTGFGGASVGYEGSRSYIGGAMDNRTSSERWS
jgi:hypothetical protein